MHGRADDDDFGGFQFADQRVGQGDLRLLVVATRILRRVEGADGGHVEMRRRGRTDIAGNDVDRAFGAPGVDEAVDEVPADGAFGFGAAVEGQDVRHGLSPEE